MTAWHDVIDKVTADELRSRGSVKWSLGPDVLGAFVAEMDFGVAPAVQAALAAVAERAEYGYLSDRAAARLGQACAGFQQAAHGWAVDPGQVWAMADVFQCLEAAITVFSRPGSPVILPTPAYMPFLVLPGLLGREVIQVPMAAGGDGRLTLDCDGIDAAFRAGGHLLILVNPANPVGRVYSAAELTAVAQLAGRHGGVVFADEIHAPLTYPGARHVPYAMISPLAASHAVTAVAASKAWNLPGLKCAQLIMTSEELLPAWRRQWKRFDHAASTPGTWATIAAYEDGRDWLAEVISYLDGSRALLAQLIEDRLPGVGCRAPEGTYLAWLDCRPLQLSPDPAAFFRSRAKVAGTDGAACGEAGRGHLRLNFATPRPIVRQMITQMGEALR